MVIDKDHHLAEPARHAVLFKRRIIAASDSKDPWMFAAVDSWLASRPDEMATRLDRLGSDSLHVRAGEIKEALWWGCAQPGLFQRLFGRDHAELWSAWGCALCLAS